MAAQDDSYVSDVLAAMTLQDNAALGQGAEDFILSSVVRLSEERRDAVTATWDSRTTDAELPPAAVHAAAEVSCADPDGEKEEEARSSNGARECSVTTKHWPGAPDGMDCAKAPDEVLMRRMMVGIIAQGAFEYAADRLRLPWRFVKRLRNISMANEQQLLPCYKLSSGRESSDETTCTSSTTVDDGIAALLNIGRPRAAFAPDFPCELASPFFADFKRHYNDFVAGRRVLCDSEFQLAKELAESCAAFYKTEEDRAAAITIVLKKIFGDDFTKLEKAHERGSANPDGILRSVATAVREPGAVLLLWELNHELGLGHSSPYVQCSADHAKLTSQLAPLTVRGFTRCEAFGIYMSGAHLSVLGHALLRGWQTFPLTDMINLSHLHSPTPTRAHDAVSMTKVAGLFAALRLSVGALRAAHANLAATILDGTIASAHYQEQLTFPAFFGTDVFAFRYEQHILRLVFLAILCGGGRFVIVKFTRAYPEAVHEELHRMSFAPELFAIQKNVNRSPWHAVIMEAMILEYGWITLHDWHRTSRTHKECLLVMRNIETMVHQIHAARLVIGDLRPPNIVVNMTTLDVKLVDFDMCGRFDEARYPACMNVEEIAYHRDVGSGVVVLASHDIHMLRLLKVEMRTSVDDDAVRIIADLSDDMRARIGVVDCSSWLQLRAQMVAVGVV